MLNIRIRLSFSVGAARRLLAGTCLAGMAAISQPAYAQDDTTQSNDHGIGEIVVTARYVEESVQDTPIAISAQTDEQLEAANVTNIGSLGAVIPNLQTTPGHSFSAGDSANIVARRPARRVVQPGRAARHRDLYGRHLPLDHGGFGTGFH